MPTHQKTCPLVEKILNTVVILRTRQNPAPPTTTKHLQQSPQQSPGQKAPNAIEKRPQYRPPVNTAKPPRTSIPHNGCPHPPKHPTQGNHRNPLWERFNRHTRRPYTAAAHPPFNPSCILAYEIFPSNTLCTQYLSLKQSLWKFTALHKLISIPLQLMNQTSKNFPRNHAVPGPFP